MEVARDQAMILEVLNLTGDKLKGKSMFDLIAKQLSSNSWHSTQTTAYSLLSISKFVGNVSQSGLNYVIENNGKSNNVNSESAIHRNNLSVQDNNELQITNR